VWPLSGNLTGLETLLRYDRADMAAMGAIFDIATNLLGLEPDLFGTVGTFSSWAASVGWRELHLNQHRRNYCQPAASSGRARAETGIMRANVNAN